MIPTKRRTFLQPMSYIMKMIRIVTTLKHEQGEVTVLAWEKFNDLLACFVLSSCIGLSKYISRISLLGHEPGVGL